MNIDVIGGKMMNVQNDNNELPKSPEPYWRQSVDLPSFEKLTHDIEAEVCIVGGGITGITTAYELTQAGVKVVLIDADHLLNGTTGHTTAKLTAQHGIIYDEFINHFGVEKTKLYYEASTDAIHYVKNLVSQKRIECDFKTQDAIIYSISDADDQKVRKEYAAYERLGIPNELKNSIPFSIETQSVLAMKEQAQFHPLQYLNTLLTEIVNNGGQIFEHTVAVDVEETPELKVITREGPKIKCNYIVAASHFPFYDAKGFYFSRMYAERSYVLAAKIDSPYPGGMYYSSDSPKRSLRSVTIKGQEYVLISGDGHKTGQGKNTKEHYEALQTFGEQVLGMKEIAYRWSAQDLYTLDKMPYIGHITENSPRILIATGYRKWGMTNGTFAATLLKDIILENDNKYKELFSPSRFVADPSLKKFITTNFDVAGHLIEGKLERPTREIKDLKLDEGAVVTVNGERAGAYKDEQGNVYCVDTTCTHMKCELEWNDGERSWDCPCHGSRFSVKGEVLEGPADKPLKQINVN